MPSVDNRVVHMDFDNAAFERKISQTLASLATLNKSLEMRGAHRGLSDLNAAANSFNISSMASGIDAIASKFSALGAIGFSVIQRLTNSALDFVKKVGGDILEPILGGGRRRAENIEQAKFMFEGLGISVEGAMDSALAAVKGTAFGLDEAAQAAAVFGASGIKVGDDMTGALRGVAGAAAMTGRSFKEIGDIFTSSAGTGVVNNQDLQQFATRGLNAAAAVAKVMGKTEAEVHEMAANGKLDFQTFANAMDEAFGEHATKANQTFSGSLANMRAAFARLGARFFGPALTHFRDIFNTLTPVIDNVAEALQPVIDAMINILGLSKGKFQGFLFLRNLNWDDLKEGAKNFAAAITNAFAAIGLVFGRFKEAFRDIFPSDGGSGFVSFTENVRKLSEILIPSQETMTKLTSIFRGFFAILEIGWTVIKEGAKFIKDLITDFTSLGEGDILGSLAGFGDFFTALNEALVEGEGIKGFFDGLRERIEKIVPQIEKIKEAISDFFGGFDLGKANEVEVRTGHLADRFERLKQILGRAGAIFEPLMKAFGKVAGFLDDAFRAIAGWFKELGSKLADVLGEGDFSDVLDAINTALLGGIVLLVSNFVRNGFAGLGGGMFDSITGAFDSLTGVLDTMQTSIKAEAIKKIAIAIAILTASVVVLSLIDSGALTKALAAMAHGFAQLMAVFLVINTMATGPKSAANFTMIATGMTVLAGSMLTLSVAALILSTLDWDELARGLAGIAGMLALITTAAIIISKYSGSFILASIGITLISGSLIILAGAVKLFGGMEWGEIGKGLVAIAGVLVVIGAAVSAMPATLALQAAGLVLVSIALNAIAASMLIFGSMELNEIGKALLALAGALVVIGAAVSSMPATMALQAVGLLLVADALVIIAGVMKVFGSMEWDEIGRSMVVLAGSLVIIGAAVTGMSGAIPGAIALGIVALALIGIAKVIDMFASIETGDLIKALIGIAAALTVIGVAAYLLFTTGATIAILALGYALVVLGAGIALIGGGVYLLAAGFEKLASSGIAGVKALASMVKTIGASVPGFMHALAKGFLEFLKTLLTGVPLIVKLITAILDQMLDTMIKLVPKLLILVGVLVEGLLKNVKEQGPTMIKVGFLILTKLLEGVRDNITNLTNLGIEIIIRFVAALTDRMTEITEAGANLLIAFIQGLTEQVDPIMDAVSELIITFISELGEHYGEIVDAGTNMIIMFMLGVMANVGRIVGAVAFLITEFIRALGEAGLRILFAGIKMIVDLINGITIGIGLIAVAVGDMVTEFIRAIGSQGLRILLAGVDMIVDLLKGIAQSADIVITAGVNTIISFIQGLSKNALKLARAAADVIIDFIRGLRQAVDEKGGEFREQGRLLAGAIINGLTGGLAEKAKDVVKKTVQVVKDAFNAAKDWLLSRSPSKRYMQLGRAMADGISVALRSDSGVKSQTVGLLERATQGVKTAISKITSELENTGEFKPTITPVLDLTEVQSGASKISGLIGSGKLSPSVSFDNARVISSVANRQNGSDSDKAAAGTAGINFEQNIYAPTRLSTNDIYKQTRNQIAMAKEELRIP